MIADFNFYGDTHCSCGVGEEGTTSQSKTTSTKDTSTISTTPSTSSTTTITETTTEPSTTSTETTTTTSSTTETSTSTTSTTEPSTTTELPCGTFVTYDIINDVTAPEKFGVQGGILYKDNATKEYVGYGDGSGCTGQNPAPCFILTTIKPGCYVTCGGGEKFDDKSVKYLLPHPQLTWIPTDSTAMMNVPGTLKITGGGNPFMFGRVLYNGNYQLGKVHAGAGNYAFYFQGPSNAIQYTTGFEVLACSSITTTSATTSTTTTTIPPSSSESTSTVITTTTLEPTTTTILTTSTTTIPVTTTIAPCAIPSATPLNTTIPSSYPCGTFLPYDPVNGRYDPDNWGVPGGVHYKDGTVTYVGYIDATGCAGLSPCPGYISTALAKPGGFCACQSNSSEWADYTKARYLLWHPKLAWVNTTVISANTINNAIKFDYTSPALWYLKLGRTCSSNRLQIGRLHYMASVFRFMDTVAGYKEASGSTAFQILVCNP